VVDDTSMPHIHTIVQALFRQSTAVFGDVLVIQLFHAALFTAKERSSASRSAHLSASCWAS
jgi:hypothetical protein